MIGLGVVSAWWRSLLNDWTTAPPVGKPDQVAPDSSDLPAVAGTASRACAALPTAASAGARRETSPWMAAGRAPAFFLWGGTSSAVRCFARNEGNAPEPGGLGHPSGSAVVGVFASKSSRDGRWRVGAPVCASLLSRVSAAVPARCF